MIIIGCLFICIGVVLLRSNKLSFAIDKYSYYVEQYKKTLILAEQYNGFLGREYSFLAEQWKDLKNECIKNIIVYFLGGIIAITTGGIFAQKGFKMKGIEITWH